MLKTVTGFIARFLKDRRANVAMTFGLLAVPMIGAAGLGIDMSRGFMTKQRISHAIDAAALAVARAGNLPQEELQELAQNYFNANYDNEVGGGAPSIQLSIEGQTVRITAEKEVPTTLMGAIGIDSMSVGAATEVTKQVSGVEVVMVLDNTGSMRSNGKIDALKEAARDLVNVLHGEDGDNPHVKIGLVPFSAAVNVGTQYEDEFWIDTEGRSSLNGQHFSDGKHASQMYAALSNKDWNGCVEARPSPLDVNDTVPTLADGDTLWVPYFAPDEPDDDIARLLGVSYTNNYLEDNPQQAEGRGRGQNRGRGHAYGRGRGGDDDDDDDDDRRRGNSLPDTHEAHQQNAAKYENATASGDGPHFNCDITPLTPLTGNRETVLDAINAMRTDGSTNIPFGMVWGWRVLSPELPFTEGVAYDHPATRKVVILLTDGENSIGSLSNPNRSYYNAHGYVNDSRLGTRNANQAHDVLDDRLEAVCGNIKSVSPDRPVLVYTITFQVNSRSTRRMMERCASQPEMYFDSPSNAELKRNFEAIAGQLSNLRISR